MWNFLEISIFGNPTVSDRASRNFSTFLTWELILRLVKKVDRCIFLDFLEFFQGILRYFPVEACPVYRYPVSCVLCPFLCIFGIQHLMYYLIILPLQPMRAFLALQSSWHLALMHYFWGNYIYPFLISFQNKNQDFLSLFFSLAAVYWRKEQLLAALEALGTIFIEDQAPSFPLLHSFTQRQAFQLVLWGFHEIYYMHVGFYGFLWSKDLALSFCYH